MNTTADNLLQIANKNPAMDQDGSVAEALNDKAKLAASQMRTLGHEGRLMVLCHLSDKPEMSVGELEAALGLRQATVSQLLARLRLDGMVDFRRDGKTLYYRITDGRIQRVVQTLYKEYCNS